MSMNAEIKAQWIAALRSGEYRQGQGSLNADGKLCCLGVLCEVAVKAEIVEPRVNEDFAVVTYDGRYDTLPASVREWAGLPEGNKYGNPNNPAVIVTSEYHDRSEVSLAELNDGKGGAERTYTFAEIADLIEAQL